MGRCNAEPATRPAGTGLLAVGIAAVLLLAACAPTPDAGWKPEPWSAENGVTLVRGEPVSEDPAAEDPATDAPTDEDPEPGEDPAADPAAESPAAEDPAPSAAGVTAELLSSLVGHRIRNDDARVQARWVHIPDEPEFNARVDEIVRAAVTVSGGYRPRVFPADARLDERGCVAGSVEWPAEQVLSEAATGPQGAAGTAVTCEIAGAFGQYIGVTMRVVRGDAEGVSEDQRTTIYADLASEQLIDSSQRWDPEAASDLWLRTVELLRREAGALSRAEVADPPPEQVEIAAAALERSWLGEGGALRVEIGPGIAAPELADLGVAPLEEPVLVEVAADVVEEWSANGYAQLNASLGEPFVGVPRWTADSVVTDCSLVPCIALTYDDGPAPATPELLETLRRYRAPATFYMIGDYVTRYPESVERVAAEGHEIGSHTMSHPDLRTLSPKEVRAQVLDAARLISDRTGEPVLSFRPPYGAIDAKRLRAVGLPAVLWSIDTNDWKRPGKKELVKRAATAASPGDIVLFHDAHDESVEAAGPVLKELRRRGFVPVTVTGMLGGSLPEGLTYSASEAGRKP